MPRSSMKSGNNNMLTLQKDFALLGINEQGYGKMSNNMKGKWVCSECKVDWASKKITQMTNEKDYNIKQLTESVQYMSNKFDKFNVTVGKY